MARQDFSEEEWCEGQLHQQVLVKHLKRTRIAPTINRQKFELHGREQKHPLVKHLTRSTEERRMEKTEKS